MVAYLNGDEMNDPHDDKILDRIYDVAVDPARLEELLESWETMLANGDGVAPAFSSPGIESHFMRATMLLDRWKDTDAVATGAYYTVLENFKKIAAFSVDKALRVRACNKPARRVLGLRVDDPLTVLPLEAEDIERLKADVLKVQTEHVTRTLRFFSPSLDHSMIFQLKASFDPDIGPFVVIVTSETGWPDGFDALLIQTFGLSQAEVAVLRSLVRCKNLREIAKKRGRSRETIRAQVRSIMAKTDTHSQAELVRMVLALLDVVNATSEPRTPDFNSREQALAPVAPRSIQRQDGRRVEYLVLGDEHGWPCLYMPSDYGLTRWAARAEAEAKRRKMRIIVPVRGGFGGSDFYARGADMATEINADLKAILDREAVQRCPAIVLGGDSFFTFLFADAFPERLTTLVLCDPLYPLSTPEQYHRMDKWYRFIMANARFAPHLLPFMVKAGMHLARKIGTRNFIDMVFGASPGDMAVASDPQVFEAIAVGTAVTVSRDHMAHAAFSADLLMQERIDWRPHVRATAARLPVYSLHGGQSQMIVSETLEELRAEYDGIDFRVYPDIGSLLFFKEWRDVLDLVDKHRGKHSGR